MLQRVVFLLFATVLVACGDGSPPSKHPDTNPQQKPEPPFEVRGSVEQIDIWKAPPGAAIEVHDGKGGKVVLSGTADKYGSLVLRQVAPSDDYAVTVPSLDVPNTRSPVKVTTAAASLPPQSFYKNQKLKAGYNYITTRDGTKLAAYITFPGPADQGPYPTVVNYSGYNPAQPGSSLGDQYAIFCPEFPVLCDAPTDGSATFAALFGYATVGVNMRGTGCSGGAYDYFEELQLLDGYDVIETVAAQDWVQDNKVGMTGLSYPGIAQLFVAHAHPPSLEAITPLSVIGNTYSTGRPGGIFNDGFALEWITEVLDKAAPYGQGWEQGLVDKGDKVCEENQLLHAQKVDVIQKAKDNPYYSDAIVGPLNPTAFVNDIDIPVFMACAWQDEQTGPFFFTMLDQFTSAPIARFTHYNGVHVDGFAPQVLVEWEAFLDLYVGKRVPHISDDIRNYLGPPFVQSVFQSNVNFPPDRFASFTDWKSAKASYEAEQPYRVIFENGGDPTQPGAPEGEFEIGFDSWPHPATSPLRLYFQPDGSLQPTAPTDPSAASTFQLDPTAGHRGILAPGGNIWDPLPDYDWQPPAAGFATVFVSDPLPADLVMLGSASVDVWIRSQVNDADLEANISEVRPDGQEMFVQVGWLRASVRKLADSATELWPEHTYTEADAAPLVAGEWNEARIGVPAFAHVFRAGSRIRVSIDTPGDSRSSWQFALATFPGTVTYDVGHNATQASSVVLPVLAGQTATTPLPPCPSLRAQPCRAFAAYVNTPSAP